MGEDSRYRWLLERQLGWISAADSKAAVLGALPIAMLTISLSNVDVSTDLIGWRQAPLLISSFFLLSGLWFTKAALTPRVDGPKYSLIFFLRISEIELGEYVEKTLNQSDEDFAVDLLQQIHRNASIAAHKHRNVGKAALCLAIATPIWLTSILFGG